MKLFRIMFILLFLILSMGLVSAQDNLNDTMQADIPSAEEIGSFDELENDIINANSTLEITKNYRNDNYSKGITVARDNLVINGNNHAIDGNGQKIFSIKGSNITINNLTFINACSDDYGAAISNKGEVTFNNVAFVNNSAGNAGGAIDNMGMLVLNNVSFADNFAGNYGGAICNDGAELDICNSSITSKGSTKFAQIFSRASRISIDNLTVVNVTAPYSPAIYAMSSNVSIVNSRFMNLTAEVSAGAICAKEDVNLYMWNCEFINTTSSKNAGAVYVDILGNDDMGMGSVTILDTLFEDTSSGFGGAIIQLGGNLLLNNSCFIKNSATFDGGAAYFSYVNAQINGCTFDSDSIGLFEDYPTYGGAIYFDYGNLILNNSQFTNTSAYDGSGAICIYDSLYVIADSTFDGGEAIHAIFKREGSQVINCSGNFTVSDENVFYPWVIVGEGMNLTPIADELNFDSLPARFDLRDYNWTAPARNQGIKGACWAFGIAGALESALLKSCGLSTDLSENNMQNTMLIYSKYGSNRIEGGSSSIAAAYCLNWLGVVSEEEDAYDEIGKISPTITGSGNIHVQDVVFIRMDHEIANGDPSFKQAILKYGGFACNVYGSDASGALNEFYNAETHAQYAYNMPSNHEVCVVGWDDSFSRENFITTPPGDGAWICKNTWGSDFGDGGYYYVSYYDTTLSSGNSDCYGFLLENKISYNKNYRYDFGGDIWFTWFVDGNPITYLNEFESCGDDLMAAVGTYFYSPGVEYYVDILVNGELVYTQEGISPYRGYHTIKLDKYIPIKKGDKFSAAVTSNKMPYIKIKGNRQHYTSGLSYYMLGGKWSELYDLGIIACLKVYTVADNRHNATLIAPDRVIGVNDAIYGYDYRFILKDENGTALANKDVLVSFNGECQTVMTDENGWGTVNVKADREGSYTVEITFAGDNGYYSISQNATVKLVWQKTAFVAPDRVVYVRDMSNGYEYSAILKDNYGKALANKKMLFIFNGKKQVAYTDENGWATVTLNADTAGLQSVTIMFAGDRCYQETAITKTIKVVRESSKITATNTAFMIGNKDKKVSVSLKSKSGNLIYGAKVSFTVGGKEYFATTGSDGVATFSIDLFKLGTFHASTRFEDSRFYAATTTTSKVIIY